MHIPGHTIERQAWRVTHARCPTVVLYDSLRTPVCLVQPIPEILLYLPLGYSYSQSAGTHARRGTSSTEPSHCRWTLRQRSFFTRYPSLRRASYSHACALSLITSASNRPHRACIPSGCKKIVYCFQRASYSETRIELTPKRKRCLHPAPSLSALCMRDLVSLFKLAN